MPKYRVLKDLPFMKAGEEVEIEVNENVYQFKIKKPTRDFIWPNPWGDPRESVFFEEVKPGRWMPEQYMAFFYVGGSGETLSDGWIGTQRDYDLHAFGNCFSSREKCNFAAQKVKELLLKIHEEEV